MKATLKKKLTAAILAGCSTFILSGVALANPPQLPPPHLDHLYTTKKYKIIAHNLKVIILGCIYLLVKMLQKILCL